MFHEIHLTVKFMLVVIVSYLTFHVILLMRYLTGLKCNIIEGMLTPVGVMALIEVATIGAMVVYVNKKGNAKT